jgi:hypothetical protein
MKKDRQGTPGVFIGPFPPFCRSFFIQGYARICPE